MGDAGSDATNNGTRSNDVAVLAPTGRDGSLASGVLARWGISAQPCPHYSALVESIRLGIGAAIVAEEALVERARHALLSALEQQPSWSDVPLIILTAQRDLSPATADDFEGIAARSNATLLERPVRIATLVTTVRSALRARARQYDVRDHMVALGRARAEAEEANRAKLEFLAMMSHELRTPLNAIGGYVDLLELGVHGTINEAQRQDLARIQRSQRHLLSLINGVLNFARIERGTVDYQITSVAMIDLMTTAESLVSPQARTRGLTLDFTGCTEAVRVCADREKLEQVLLNLLGNAIKFTDSGGRVSLRCEQRGEWTAIIVEDTGQGIPSNKLSSVFEPFVQLDSRLTRSRDGVGLGLAISRDLARGMGGDLTAESEVGVGSRFTVMLRAA
ncbi:MAG: sensor histidine kinase [Gemmatimonadales bacterium]